jgi:hypothetical protein
VLESSVVVINILSSVVVFVNVAVVSAGVRLGVSVNVSVLALLVAVRFVPATIVSVSPIWSETRSLCPDTATTPKAALPFLANVSAVDPIVCQHRLYLQ